MRARGKAEEVDAIGQATDVDLCVARGIAFGNFLSHAVVHLIGELGIASADKQGVADGVRIDGKFGLGLVDGIQELNDDAFRYGNTVGIFGHHAIGEETILADDLVSVSRFSGLTDFDTVAVNDVVDGTLRSSPSQGNAGVGSFSLQVLDRVE